MVLEVHNKWFAKKDGTPFAPRLLPFLEE